MALKPPVDREGRDDSSTGWVTAGRAQTGWWGDRVADRPRVLLIFIIQNTDKVRFQFLFWTFTWPLWWYTIMTALFGALVWFGLGVMRRHRRRVERRAAR